MKKRIYKILGILFIITAILTMFILVWQFWPTKTIWFDNKENTQNDSSFTKPAFIDKMTGLPSDNEEDLDPQAIIIMVDNFPASHPLSGLNDAKIVYEAPVEGGMTRFMAIFSKNQEVKKIGPVRSARPDYFDWAKEYGIPLYMHCGGSPEALKMLKIEKGMLNVDEFYNTLFFWRDKQRIAPHNLFTSSSLWIKAFEKYQKEPLTWQTFLFGQNQNTVPASEIKVVYSEGFFIFWKYNFENGFYERYVNNKKVEDNEGNVITAQTLIITKNQVKILDEVGRRSIHNIGSGEAFILSQGQMKKGSWKKSQAQYRTRFYDENEGELSVPPGKIWFMSVPENNEVTF